MTRTENQHRKSPARPTEIASFWRRCAAFMIDLLVLGLVGFGLGLLLQAQFEAMGAWGLAIGFPLALAYFSIMESVPAALRAGALSVTVVHGYDIGIVSKWSSTRFDFSPDALQQQPSTHS